MFKLVIELNRKYFLQNQSEPIEKAQKIFNTLFLFGVISLSITNVTQHNIFFTYLSITLSIIQLILVSIFLLLLRFNQYKYKICINIIICLQFTSLPVFFINMLSKSFLLIFIQFLIMTTVKSIYIAVFLLQIYMQPQLFIFKVVQQIYDIFFIGLGIITQIYQMFIFILLVRFCLIIFKSIQWNYYSKNRYSFYEDFVVSIYTFIQIFQKFASTRQIKLFTPNCLVFLIFVYFMLSFIRNIFSFRQVNSVLSVKLAIQQNEEYDESCLKQHQILLFKILNQYYKFMNNHNQKDFNDLLLLSQQISMDNLDGQNGYFYKVINFNINGVLDNILYNKISNNMQESNLLFAQYDCQIIGQKVKQVQYLYSLININEEYPSLDKFYNKVCCMKLIIKQLQFLQKHYYHSQVYHQLLIQFVNTFKLSKQISYQSVILLRNNQLLLNFQESSSYDCITQTQLVTTNHADFTSIFSSVQYQKTNLYKEIKQYFISELKSQKHLWYGFYIIVALQCVAGIVFFVLQQNDRVIQTRNIKNIEPSYLCDAFIHRKFNQNLSSQSFSLQQLYNLVNKKRYFLENVDIIYPKKIIRNSNFIQTAISNEQYCFQLKSQKQLGKFVVNNFISQIIQDWQDKTILYNQIFFRFKSSVLSVYNFYPLLFCTAMWLLAFMYQKSFFLYQLGLYLTTKKKITVIQKINIYQYIVMFFFLLIFLVAFNFNLSKFIAYQIKKNQNFSQEDWYYTEDLASIVKVHNNLINLSSYNSMLQDNQFTLSNQEVELIMTQINFEIKSFLSDDIQSYFAIEGQGGPQQIASCFILHLLQDVKEWMISNRSPQLFNNSNQFEQQNFQCITDFEVTQGASSYFSELTNISSMQLLNPRRDTRNHLAISLNGIHKHLEKFIKDNDLSLHYNYNYYNLEQIMILLIILLSFLLMKVNMKAKLFLTISYLVIITIQLVFYFDQCNQGDYFKKVEEILEISKQLGLFANLLGNLYPSELVSILSSKYFSQNVLNLKSPYQEIKCSILHILQQNDLSINGQSISIYIQRLGFDKCKQSDFIKVRDILKLMQDKLNNYVTYLSEAGIYLHNKHNYNITLNFIAIVLLYVIILIYGILSFSGFPNKFLSTHFFKKFKIFIYILIVYIILGFLCILLNHLLTTQYQINLNYRDQFEELIPKFYVIKLILSKITFSKRDIELLRYKVYEMNIDDLSSFSNLCYNDLHQSFIHDCTKHQNIQFMFENKIHQVMMYFYQHDAVNIIDNCIYEDNILLQQVTHVLDTCISQSQRQILSIFKKQEALAIIQFIIGISGFICLFNLVRRGQSYYQNYLEAIEFILIHQGKISPQDVEIVLEMLQ
ncbi:Transmembrane domain-containing protein [Spironucleus salmonicida]|uniref:Transmembrane domain-containing protein n=1 Tax=Spironucleus salmonicida TaxID=348837 RepID=V6LSE3_9EUKA|nr:Transmembrane domain-containing protein [Spironucleus salmonicida]|eukprot:EST47520.1 Transmembrane domain-containing protein [Spironucleus salmonicida]